MTATYVLNRNGAGKYVFTFKTHDGQELLTSQAYADKDRALRAIDAARVLARRARNYEICTAEGGQAYYVLKHARWGVIGQSEMYPDSESVLEGITVARAKTRGAQLEDLTDNS